MKVDNFALTMHQACPAKYDLRIRKGWQSRRRSGALGYGSAIHAGWAVWYQTHDEALAIEAIRQAWDDSAPADDFRTLERCIQTFREYVKQYPEESFQVVQGPSGPLVEIAFTLATGMFCDCDNCGPTEHGANDEGNCRHCGAPCEPIEYGGIFDMLVQFGNSVYVVDHKTTSQLGPYYFNQFKPNNQMTGYIWGAQQLSGKKVDGAIINAVCTTKSGKLTFARQITTRTPEQIARWMLDVRSSCNEIRYHERTGHWPLRTTSCTMYGKCEFHDVHVLGNEIEEQRRLEQDYIFDPWDYESRDDAALPTAE